MDNQNLDEKISTASSAGINEDRMQQLKVDLLTVSEEIKKLLIRVDECKLVFDSSVQFEDKESILKKIIEIYTELNNFYNNVSYYNDSLGKVLSTYQEMDLDLGETIKRDIELVLDKEVN